MMHFMFLVSLHFIYRNIDRLGLPPFESTVCPMLGSVFEVECVLCLARNCIMFLCCLPILCQMIYESARCSVFKKNLCWRPPCVRTEVRLLLLSRSHQEWWSTARAAHQSLNLHQARSRVFLVIRSMLSDIHFVMLLLCDVFVLPRLRFPLTFPRITHFTSSHPPSLMVCPKKESLQEMRLHVYINGAEFTRSNRYLYINLVLRSRGFDISKRNYRMWILQCLSKLMPCLGRCLYRPSRFTRHSERFSCSKQNAARGKTLQHKTWRAPISGSDHVLCLTNKVTCKSNDTLWSSLRNCVVRTLLRKQDLYLQWLFTV